MSQSVPQPSQSPQVEPQKRRRRGWVPLVLGVVILAAAFCLYDFYKDDIWPKRLGEVVPGLIYRSGQISPRIIEKTLQDRHIRTVINLQADVHNSDPVQAAELDAAQRLGIYCFRYALAGDGTGDIVNYADAIQKLVECQHAGKPVLIHCAAGTQRTGVAIAYYRVLVQNQPAAQVYDEMLSYGMSPRKDRPALNYLNDHMAELARLLVDRGVLPKVPDPLPRFDLPAPD